MTLMPFGSLPPGVRLQTSGIEDEVRGGAWPLNHTAIAILRLVLERPLDQSAAILSTKYSLQEDIARRDILQFCRDLNRKSLLNINETLGSYLTRIFTWVPVALFSLILASTPISPPTPPVTRRHVDTSSRMRAVASVSRSLSMHSLKLGGIISLAASAPLLAIGGVEGIIAMCMVALTIGLSMIVHEAGHAIMLVGTPCSIERSGMGVWIRHAPVSARQQILVSAGGPLAASCLAIIVLAAAELTGFNTLALLIVGLAPHSLGLTVLSRDGRRACGLS